MRNYYKTNSHYLTYTSSLKNVRRMYFLSSGVKGLPGDEPLPSMDKWVENHGQEKGKMKTCKTMVKRGKDEPWLGSL